MASPIKVTRVNSITRVPKAEVTIQGATRKFAVPCLSNSPRLGVGGGSPKPRKSREVIAEIADTMINGMKVTSVDKTLGRIWLKIMRVSVAPIILAAAM